MALSSEPNHDSGLPQEHQPPRPRDDGGGDNDTHWNAPIGDILAWISHEFKTPLTAILGLSSLLKEQDLGELSDRQLHYINLIHQSGSHLILLLNEILLFTQLQSGSVEFYPTKVDVGRTCQYAFDSARELFQANPSTNHSNGEIYFDSHSVQDSVDIDPGLAWVITDEVRLRQMLVYLLTTALKLSDSSIDIKLQVHQWDQHWIGFTVCYRGVCFPRENNGLLHHFPEFSPSSPNPFEGSYLGLVLMQRLTHLQGGMVTVRSIGEQRSECTLLLPCKYETLGVGIPHLGGETGTSLVVVEPTSHEVILLAQDDPWIIESLSAQLLELGYRVVNGYTCPDVLRKARLLQPRAILLSASLWANSQFSLFDVLHDCPETCHIPLVMTVQKTEQSAFPREGEGEMIQLPISLSKLDATVRKNSSIVVVSEQILPPSLTILQLLDNHHQGEPHYGLGWIGNLFHQKHYRLIEAEDLEQANLLARIWKPDLLLLTTWDKREGFWQFVEFLQDYDGLSPLPLVILNHRSHRINPVQGLSLLICPISHLDRTEDYWNHPDALNLCKTLRRAVTSH